MNDQPQAPEWLKKVKEKLRDTLTQENIIITVKELKQAIARISNWKAAGPDHVPGFWFKKATSLHSKHKQHLQECVNAGQVYTIHGWQKDTQYSS